MIAIISAIGFGSIVAAVVGWYGVISNHRQAWINALRDDLAMFLRELEVMHYAIGDLFAAKTVDELPPLEKQKQDSEGCGFIYSTSNSTAAKIHKNGCTQNLPRSWTDL
jgi:hypothetical protein